MKVQSLATKAYIAIAVIGALVIAVYFAFTLRMQGKMIFVGAVTQSENVAAPVQFGVLTGQEHATAVGFRIRHVWQGAEVADITAFTWGKGTAPCQNAEMKPGRSYIVVGEWDPAQKNLVFDSCQTMADDTPDSPHIRRELDRTMRPEKKD